MKLIQSHHRKLFRGKQRAPNYRELVHVLLEAYRNFEYILSLKIYFLHSHLGFLPPSLGEVRDEHGEMLHRDILLVKKRH